MNLRLFLYGLGIWIMATIGLRVTGQHLLRPGDVKGTLILFLISFPLMAWLVRRLCRRFESRAEQWPAGAISIALPTLLLDPFSSVFFPVVFPNMSPEVAGGLCGGGVCGWAGALGGVRLLSRGR